MKSFAVFTTTERDYKRVSQKMLKDGYRWNIEPQSKRNLLKTYENGTINSLNDIWEDEDFPKYSAQEYLQEEEKPMFKVGDRCINLLTSTEMKIRKENGKLTAYYPKYGESSTGYEIKKADGKWRLKNFPDEYLQLISTPEEKEEELTLEKLRELYRDAHRYSFGGGWDIGIEPINNFSPKRGTIQTMLKKVTNLIKGLTQPLQNYVRLGWVEIEDDEYVVTEEGQQAFVQFSFGLTEHSTMKGYASEEVARLEKEEKKKK